MVFVNALWWVLKEHTLAPYVMAYRMLRRVVEHLQEHMTSREVKLEALAEDMRDPVTKRKEMAFIKYSPQVTTMEVRPQGVWRLWEIDDAGEEAGQAVDEQRERLLECMQRRIPQV